MPALGLGVMWTRRDISESHICLHAEPVVGILIVLKGSDYMRVGAVKGIDEETESEAPRLPTADYGDRQ